MNKKNRHKPSPKTIWKVLFAMWIITGTSALIRGDISRISYGCLLVSALLYIIEIIYRLGKEDEDADNK